MNQTVYIETSVVSYYTARYSNDVIVAGHQRATREFWPMLSSELSPFVSALVLIEAGKGNVNSAQKRLDAIASFTVLPVTFEAEQLAQKIIDGRGVPARYPEDALHIAVAAVAGLHFIVTWNFSHINNPFTKLTIRRIVESGGYNCSEIVSPDAFLGEV